MRRPTRLTISRPPANTPPARRVDAIGSVMGKSYERPTGVSLPFKGQPLQGHSGIKTMPDGSFWVLTDNGMGSRYNSADLMLYLNRHKIDWASGKIERQETIFLHDPDKKVPFRIVHEDTAKRYLTGADFDTEGFQIIGDTFWIGDEFGPYVLKADKTGKILAVFETMADGKPVRSPDHWSVQSPGAPGASYTTVNLRRSKGYEGFGGVEGRQIPLRPARRPAVGCREEGLGKGRRQGSRADPRIRRRRGKIHRPLLALCVRAERPRHRRLQHDRRHQRPDHRARQWRRHRRQGLPAGQRGENCFPDLAKFKRVYKIELTDANVGKPVRKIAYIDLMKIRDPDKKARKPLNDGVLTFPFFTIENVDRVDDDPHHRRQRQQPAVLLEPRSQQGRRQRVRAAGSRRIS